MEIDRLLDIVARGGSVKTGIDIHNKVLRPKLFDTEKPKLFDVVKAAM